MFCLSNIGKVFAYTKKTKTKSIRCIIQYRPKEEKLFVQRWCQKSVGLAPCATHGLSPSFSLT